MSKKRLRVWFMILSAIGWVLMFGGLGAGSWVAFTIGLPIGLGFGIAAFALKA